MSSEQFLWQSATAEDPKTRKQISEQALEDAKHHGAKLLGFFKSYLDDADLSKSVDVKLLQKWVRDLDALPDKQKDELLIGVQGQTGAGKSSLLNTILGYHGLLPSSSAEASTATVCRVAYNYSEDAERLFYAVINFTPLQEMREQLDRFFEDLKQVVKLSRPETDDESISEDDRERSRAEASANIKDMAVQIHAVWGFGLRELEGLSTADLLKKGDPAEKLLGSKKTVYGPDQKIFAREVKPYLDSTKKEGKGVSGTTNKSMALWPLIDSVDLYVKSPILKGGLVLVDLPGLSDVVAGRAAVARKYYDKLAVAVVVTPCVRAADEYTGVELITSNQMINMRMDGKFDDRSFCVVLSKTDGDIDWASDTCEDDSSAEKVRMLEKASKEVEKYKDAAGSLKQKMKNASKAIKRIDDESEKNKVQDEIKKWKRQRKSCLRKTDVLKAEYSKLAGACAFKSITARNKLLTRRIWEDMKYRHDELMARSGSTTGLFRDLFRPRIFPVSVKAYWDLEGRVTKPCVGFPSVLYSGIPALREWISETTIPQRERQDLALLNHYLILFKSMQSWSDGECKKHRFTASPEEVKAGISDATCTQLRKKLDVLITKGVKSGVKGCNPFKSRDTVLEEIAKALPGIVENWAMKIPDSWAEEYFGTKLYHSTFKAIVSRGGGDFVSHAGGKKRKYNWIENMALVFKTLILGPWIEEVHGNIPDLERKIRLDVDKIWKQILLSIEKALPHFFPGLYDEQEYFHKQVESLSPIKEELKDRIGQALLGMSTQSPTIHAVLEKELQKGWEKAFKKAKEEKGGKGHMNRRHDILKAFSDKRGKKTFTEAVIEMQRVFNAEQDKIVRLASKACSEAITKFREQLELITRNILKAADVEYTSVHQWAALDEETDSARNARLSLQRGVRDSLLGWAAAWDAPKIDTTYTAQDTRIPEEYVPTDERTWSDDEEDGGEEADWSDMDLDEDIDDEDDDVVYIKKGRKDN